MKRIFLIFVIPITLILLANNKALSQSLKLSVIVIDAGHGGKDPGAVGKNSMEKTIVLSIALKLGKLINDKYPSIKVIFTRSTDEFIELYRRAKIANENKADLFISIHCNSSKNTEPYGSETYVMGINKTKANLEVARKENASILYEENYTKQYEGYDPFSPEATIIFSLYQNLFLDQSLDFATRIQKNFTKSFSLQDRGVKQAGFLVLYNVTMPGVLVEAGFVSNPEEEAILKSPEGQMKVAKSIFKAFSEYKSFKEGSYGEIDNSGTGKEVIDSFPANKQETRLIYKSDTNITPKVQVDSKVKDSISYKVVYKIQFVISPTMISVNSEKFKGLNEVSYYIDKKVFKYTSGCFQDLAKAIDYLPVVKSKGYKDAFIVPFRNGIRISLDEAKKKLKEN